MTSKPTYFVGGPIFDGQSLKQGLTAHFEGGQLVALLPDFTPETQGRYVDLGGDILSPGYLDLQVNGGDGIMLNAEPSCAGLARIAKAHRRLGAVQILPTLITDTAEKTAQVIAAAAQAIKAGVPGIAGLHLEGPHLAQSRKGAHDAALIREMTPSDLELLIAAAEALPVLMVTLAPESVSLDQIKSLRDAGVLLSLGHSDASYEQNLEYAEAGVCCVTHLFNAMSPLNHRAPGLVGAALSSPALHAGLIADGIHVHPAAMRAAWAAKMGRPSPEGKIYLVSDAMAPAGSDISAFKLEGRQILRQNGRLTLEDGTLAGADLDLTTALRVLVSQCGIPLEEALTAAVTVPRRVIGQWSTDSCALGLGEDEFIRIQSDLGAATPINETAGL